MAKDNGIRFSVNYDEEGNVVSVMDAGGKELNSEALPGDSTHMMKWIKNGFDKFDVVSTPIIRFKKNPICCAIVGGTRIYYTC
jgi:hypothetical protein